MACALNAKYLECLVNFADAGNNTIWDTPYKLGMCLSLGMKYINIIIK